MVHRLEPPHLARRVDREQARRVARGGRELSHVIIRLVEMEADQRVDELSVPGIAIEVVSLKKSNRPWGSAYHS